LHFFANGNDAKKASKALLKRIWSDDSIDFFHNSA